MALAEVADEIPLRDVAFLPVEASRDLLLDRRAGDIRPAYPSEVTTSHR
jgi:hypothetical protein